MYIKGNYTETNPFWYKVLQMINKSRVLYHRGLTSVAAEEACAVHSKKALWGQTSLFLKSVIYHQKGKNLL